MTPTLSNQQQRTRRPVRRDLPGRSRTDRPRLRGSETKRKQPALRPLGHYLDATDRRREVIARRGFAGSVLVVDRDADTLGDRRLVAHLSADEPLENAAIVCRLYLDDARSSGCRCRALRDEDLETAPLAETQETPGWGSLERDWAEGLRDRDGHVYRLELVQTGMSIPELRWQRRSPEDDEQRSVSVRHVIAALECYEPVRTITSSALALHQADPGVSVTLLRAEFERVLVSPIVLNRGLRQAVLATIARDELSMSEIATRCGRIKRDSRGNESGETSWLARRLGMLPEGGQESPTPWIHSDVLGLISRNGLGISPREVEL